MAKPNYQFEKRQRDLAKKSKQDEKRRQKLANKAPGESSDSAANPEDQDRATPDTPECEAKPVA